MHWLGYVTGIVWEVERNTTVVPLMVSSLAYVGTVAPKYGDFLCLQANIFCNSTHHRYSYCQMNFELLLALFNTDKNHAGENFAVNFLKQHVHLEIQIPNW
jgi:hypothetical protein